jgi:hypothetical protein
MALKLVNDGAETVLGNNLNLWNNPGSEVTMHLFQNDHIPVAADTVLDYVDATFSGYAPVQLANWVAAGIVAGRAKATADRATFTHNGGITSNDIFGYYIIDNATGILLWAERDPNGPVTMASLNDEYNVDPVFTIKSEF